jgi:inhibitor of cysteine peptidase
LEKRRYSVSVRMAYGIAFAVASVILVCCTQPPFVERKDVQRGMSVNLTEESNGKEVAVNVGQNFIISLPENPTTGYVWRFVKVGNVERNATPICSKMSDIFVPKHSTSSRVGTPGIHQWHFRADAPGAATLELQLVRPWDAGSAKRSFVLHLRVT